MASVLLRAIVAAGMLTACASPADADDDANDGESNAAAQTTAANAPSDPEATNETRVVMRNLHAFDMGSSDPFDHRVILGQQESDVSNRSASGLAPVASDFASVAGRPPALVSYELSQLTRSSLTAFDAAAFRAARPFLRDRILAQHARGALVSLVWHLKCPKARVTDRDLFAPADCPADYRLESLLEGGAHHAEWRAVLDELAELLWSLKDEDGKLVPILLRPFHEFTGNWFWWGSQNAPDVYARVWRETVDYLRLGRGLHDVLWVFCPAGPADGGRFDRHYPGDAYVDVVAFDRYDFDDGTFASRFAADLSTVSAFARAHGKVAAVAEVGRELASHPDDATWFTKTLLGPLKDRSRKIAYAALWRNAPWEKFVPEANDGALAADFTRFADDDAVLLAGVHDLYSPLHR